jgi:hypothetical protein
MSRTSNTGISLIELMLSLFLGSLLLLGLMMLLSNSWRHYEAGTQNIKQEQTTHYLATIFTGIIRNAGFLGYTTFNNAQIDTLHNSFNKNGIIGYEITSNGSLPAFLKNNAQPGTEALYLQAMGPYQALTENMKNTKAQIKIVNAADFVKGDWTFISNDASATLFQITQVSTRHQTLGYNASAFHKLYSSPACVGKWHAWLFYIRKAEVHGHPGLYLQQNNHYSDELAENIDNMSFSFKLKGYSDFIKLSVVKDWRLVQQIKIILYYRNSMTQTILASLRNA